MFVVYMCVYDIIGFVRTQIDYGAGSLKSWDSSFDLVNLLKHEIRDGQLSFRGKRVLEVFLVYTSNTFYGFIFTLYLYLRFVWHIEIQYLFFYVLPA